MNHSIKNVFLPESTEQEQICLLMRLSGISAGKMNEQHLCLTFVKLYAVTLTSLRIVKASDRASPSSPIPLANSLSRCSRKCWQTKESASTPIEKQDHNGPYSWGTHVFVGSVSPNQSSIQTRLHIVDLLIVLWKKKGHTVKSQTVAFIKNCDFFVWTYCYYIKEVIVSQSVQYGGNSLPGDGQPQSFHASTDIHQDHHILGRCSCLDVPVTRNSILHSTVREIRDILIFLPLFCMDLHGYKPFSIPAVKADDTMLIWMPFYS